MSINVNDKNLGHATAYAYYKAGGGTMTEAEFTEFMADFGTASQTAVEAAQAALASETAAQTAATTATNKATEATTAATTATTKAAEASTSANTATSAKDTAVSAASTATTKATEATTAAATAVSAKDDAVSANTAAQSAKTAAQTAQTGAETAAASVSESAAQIATNTEDIAQLKSEMTQMFVYPVNRLNPNTFTQAGYVVDLTSGVVTPYGTELCVSDYVEVKAGETYTSTQRTSYYGALTGFPIYTEKNESSFVKTIPASSMDKANNRATFTSDTNGYTRVVVYKTRLSDTMFVVGSVYPDTFVPYSDKTFLADDVFINSENVVGLDSALSDEINALEIVGEKSITIDVVATVANQYVNVNGNFIDGGYSLTIEDIAAGDVYTLKAQTGSAIRTYVIKTKNGTISRTASADTWTTNHDYDVSITITDTEDGGTLYVNSVLSSYIGAKLTKYRNIVLGNKIDGIGYLLGKSISFDGDSICYGAGYLGGYGKIIADRNAMEYQNLAVSGGTITAGTTSSGQNRHWVCRSIANLSKNSDYIIIEGGVNDASLNVTMGSITTGYDSTLDDTTFCGAMESICKQLVNDFAGKKIGYIAVHQMTDKYRNTNTNLSTSYYLTALKICQKWGVPVCDLNTSVPPFAYLGSNIKNAYTYNGDGWHPNEQGYKKYYCDKIEAWMKTL